jgi:hypothetical protein
LAKKISLKKLSEAELQDRLELARQYALAPGVSDALQKDLRSIAKQTRAELQQRREAADTPEPQVPAKEEAVTPPVTPEQPPVQEATPPLPLPADPLGQEADKLIADTRSATDLNDEALRRRIQQARTLLEKEALPIEYRAPLNALVVTARGELAARAKAAGEAEQQQEADEIAIEMTSRVGVDPKYSATSICSPKVLTFLKSKLFNSVALPNLSPSICKCSVGAYVPRVGARPWY